MPRSLVALGSNVGQRAATLSRAVELLSANPEISSLAISTPHETSAIGGPPGQAPFLNSAIALDTTFSPQQLLAALRAVEIALGRKRAERWSARTIDLDLLLYGDAIVDTRELTVPHPRMAFRRFVLAPAAEVAADMTHPVIGWTVEQLLAHLDTAPHYVALLGPPGSGKTALAERLATKFAGRLLLDAPAPSDTAAQRDAGPAIARHLELLERRARLLARGEWPADEQLAVSDFYFDQSLAHAQVVLDGREMDTFEPAWRTARAEVVLPKLLVVLDTPHPGWLAAGHGLTSEPDICPPAPKLTPREQLREALLRLAVRPGVGPVVFAGRDAERQFDEASATIQAMH